ncbi:hypothetical protein A3850_007460 [Lewinella sp. 4G2]|nr:hypothetical protein A3850_007460 [Lewinella sp. 4G2]
MEDCGVTYKVDNEEKDPYEIFADAGTGMVRLRLWHTPAWYDTLNAGRRYSDLNDVKKSIGRAKAAGMQVLLDFHLTDFWADPSRQIVPAAWAEVVDDTEVLGDSVYNYVNSTLLELHAEGLLPDMVQVGNETNKGILQSEVADASGFVLDWPRNAALFNRGIKAVRDASAEAETPIKVALHVAGPENAGWLFAGFKEHGVTDFDVIGLSYYWAWHQPTTIQRTGQIIADLKRTYSKEVMIFETGYIWTMDSNDSADNIIGSVQSGYAPATTENQRQWLIDLTQEVYDRGGLGVLYWEPAWVSSTCFTPWGQGSHQEHAAFFDFDTNLHERGGADFLGYDYQNSTSVTTPADGAPYRFTYQPEVRDIWMMGPSENSAQAVELLITDTLGRRIESVTLTARGDGAFAGRYRTDLRGTFVVTAVLEGQVLGSGLLIF